MCGRYTLHQKAQALKSYYHLKALPNGLKDNFNVAPGQFMPVILNKDGETELEMMKWGLVPVWAKDPSIGYKLINARDDTIFSKPVWRNIILRQRCLIPADGFYEWQKITALDLRKALHPSGCTQADLKYVLSERKVSVDTLKEEKHISGSLVKSEGAGILRKSSLASKEQKQPFYIKPKQADLFSFAGVWETRKDVEGLELKTYSIITTSPNKEMKTIHNRMPVILHQEDYASWLEPSLSSKSDIAPFLRPYEDNELEIYKVSKNVNTARNNSAELIYPISI